MTALLEMNTEHRESEPVEKPPGKLRFTYGSGSRPLDGYTIKRGVGRGGFGEVYYAVSDAGKDVALKLIRRNLEVELRGVRHCLNLKHPNLIDVYDIRTDANDDRWVVMEYVSGASLDDVISRYDDGMPVDMAVEWFRGICEAVAYLHDHGIVHRDLKPGNIFIDDGRVKIGDYGLSKFISCSRRSGQTESVGTVHYMAPEIANGRYGREIDIYAVGIILFEMLTGHVPFEGESVGEVLMKHLTAEPDLTILSDPFRGIIAGAMAKDPEHRTQSVNEMLQRISASGIGAGTSTVTTPSLAAALAGAAGGGAAAAAAAEAAAGAAQPDTINHVGPRPVGGSPAANGAATSAPQGPASTREMPPEPIAEFVADTVKEIRQSLRVRDWPRQVRIAVFVGAIFLSIGFINETGGDGVAMLMMLAVGYFVYCGIRRHLFKRDMARLSPVATPSTPRPGQSEPQASPSGSTPPVARMAGAADHQRRKVGISRPWRRRQPTWQTAVRKHLRGMSWRDRSSQLLGSLIVAAVVASLTSLITGSFAAPNSRAELFVWMAIVTTAGSWAVLIPSKLCEGTVDDHAPLRFCQLIGGALVGLIAFAAASEMTLQVPASTEVAPGPHDSLGYNVFGVSPVSAVALSPQMHVAYFSFLLLLLRWWRMTELTRTVRVSVWSIVVAAFVGWLLTFFWWYPQPAGMLIAAGIAFTVQLSSTWMSPERRMELAEEAVA